MRVYTYALQLTLITKVVFESLPILHIRYYISCLVNNQSHWNLRLCKHVQEYNIFCYMDEHFRRFVSNKNNNIFSMKLSLYIYIYIYTLVLITLRTKGKYNVFQFQDVAKVALIGRVVGDGFLKWVRLDFVRITSSNRSLHGLCMSPCSCKLHSTGTSGPLIHWPKYIKPLVVSFISMLFQLKWA